MMGVNDSNLKKKAVKIWGQIININKRSSLFNQCAETRNISTHLDISWNSDLGWSKPEGPLQYRRVNGRNTAIGSIPATVTLK